MASSCTRRGLDWILGKISSPKGSQALDQAAQGRFLVGKKLNISQQGTAEATKANWIIGCIRRVITSRGIIPLYSAFVRLHCTWSTVPSSVQKEASRLEVVQRRATQMIKGLQNLPYEERLKQLQEKAPGDLITVFQYLKGSYKEDGGSLFTRSHMERQGETGTSCSGKGFILTEDRIFFCSENNYSLDQTPQGHGEVSIAGHFQDMIRQG
ncbi:hypothetical protein QYF61_005212, partial [Mycteria americana]